MMSVSEYAIDVDRSVEEILNICKRLNILVNNEDDMLDDDSIILLDNELANTNSMEEDIVEDEVEDDSELEDFEDSYEQELEEVKVSPKKPSFKKVDKKNDFQKQRKEMYKHKEKLISNLDSNDNEVLYTEGMVLSDLANALGVSASEVIKKLMSLGKMLTINASIDFETADFK